MNFYPPAFPTAPAGTSTKQPATTEFVTSAIGSAALTSFTDFISGLIASPTNQDYRIVESLPFAIVVTSFTGKTSTGTLQAALAYNASPLGNGAISASSTQTTTIPTGNLGSTGDALVLTVSLFSSAANFSFTVVYTRSP
jgi:hypothetical protein